jgi:hypothetical protein
MKMFFSMLVAAALVGTMAMAAQAVPQVPADVVIDHLKNPNAKLEYKVKFSHKAHASLGTDEAACKKCHHKWDGKAAIKSCAVDGCHADVTSFKATDKDPKFLMTAFHSNNPMSCQGCHKDMKKAGQKTGPSACAQCHTQK